MPIVPAYISEEAFIGLMMHTLTAEHSGVRRGGGGFELYEIPQLLIGDGVNSFLDKSFSSSQNAVQNYYLNMRSTDIKKMTGDVMKQINVLKTGMQSLQAISYANVALSGAGLAASMIGDAIIMDKLSSLQEELDQVYESNQVLLSQITSIRNITLNNKYAEYQKLKTKLYNYVLRMKTETITDALLGDIYNELMEASAFMVQMKRNLLDHACDEISPELLLELATIYMCAASLYAFCYKTHHYHDDVVLDLRIASDLGYPIDHLLEEDMQNALYDFFYSRTEGLPIERDIQNCITLPMFGIASGKRIMESSQSIACSHTTSDEKLKVELDDRLLAYCNA